jgi:hypothetical protein
MSQTSSTENSVVSGFSALDINVPLVVFFKDVGILHLLDNFLLRIEARFVVIPVFAAITMIENTYIFFRLAKTMATAK